MSKTEVIFDVETQKLFSEIDTFDPGKLGISIVSAYIRKLDQDSHEIEGKMLSFWEQDLDQLWPHFQSADRIIGFNSIPFDVPALAPYTSLPLHKYKHFDILAEIKAVFGKRISLNKVAKGTLGTQKIDVGTNAVLYWRKGDQESLTKLQKYCEADVLITRDVYDHALQNKTLSFKDRWNTPRTIEVDFSYPKEAPQTQTSLF